MADVLYYEPYEKCKHCYHKTIDDNYFGIIVSYGIVIATISICLGIILGKTGLI